MIHHLKTIDPYFTHVLSGVKTFEVRANDRDFQVGDILKLNLWDEIEHRFTGAYCYVAVTYLFDLSQWAGATLLVGRFVVMSIRVLPDPTKKPEREG